MSLAAVDAGDPTIVPLVLVGLLIGALGIFFLVALAIQRTGSPEDVAVAYELAWDRLDFERLWELSGDRLRDNRTREVFLADKRAAYEAEATVPSASPASTTSTASTASTTTSPASTKLTGLIRRATVESLEVDKGHAIARTELDLVDGATFRNELYLKRHGGSWKVEVYRLDRRAVPRV